MAKITLKPTRADVRRAMAILGAGLLVVMGMRRLVERGVRFVQTWHGNMQPWDSHSNIREEHRKVDNVQHHLI